MVRGYLGVPGQNVHNLLRHFFAGQHPGSTPQRWPSLDCRDSNAVHSLLLQPIYWRKFAANSRKSSSGCMRRRARAADGGEMPTAKQGASPANLLKSGAAHRRVPLRIALHLSDQDYKISSVFAMLAIG